MGIAEFLRKLLGREERSSSQPDQVFRELEDEDEEVDPFNPFPEPVRVEITDVFDLHSIAPRDVRMVVEEYLREARRLGYSQVRIIHGKGVGIQREAVRQILTCTPFVTHFSDAPPEAGGWGATIARLSTDKPL